MKRLALIVAMALFCLTNVNASWAAKKTEVTWYGQSAFKIVTPAGHVLFIDPWLTNPANPHGKEDLEGVKKADLILVSHGHFDHVGDAVEIAQKTKAKLVATYDLGNALATAVGYPKEQMGFDSLGNCGGTVKFFDNDIAVTYLPAVHSSSVKDIHSDNTVYGGNASGFLIAIKNGPTIYHTGDTDLFGDMALIPKYQPIDLMLACIGDHFTMGPGGAAEAVALVNPKKVIPMHYGTFPNILTGTVEEFKKALNKEHQTNKLEVLKIGQPASF